MSDTVPDHNPLLELPFAIPFHQIAPAHVEPAVDVLLARARAQLREVADREGPRTYANTIAAAEAALEPLERAMGVVGHLESVATGDALRSAYNAVQPKVAAFHASLPLDPKMWAAVREYAASDEARDLDPTRRRHLEHTLDAYRRHGAELDEAGKRELEALNVELTEKTTRFSQNVLDATAQWELVITDETELAGLPSSAIDAARASFREATGATDAIGWRFTLQAPSVIAVLTYLDAPEIRGAVYRAHNTRASSGQYDNRGLVADILRLRHRKAQLLGYRDFADLVLEDRMAKNGDAARRFIDELRTKTAGAFERENEALLEFRRKLEGPNAPPLQPWDIAYYAEKQRRAEYDFDEEALRPYFALERVVAGMFDIASRLFAIRVTPTQSYPVWHPDVQAFEVHDEDGTFLGAFYLDPFPRKTKRGGAWMNGLITGVTDEDHHEPHLGLMCANVTPPVDGRPALLTHREVETLFHEFGHLLHHTLSRVSVRSLAGTNVAWDFVELPSQIMENWCWEKPALDLFARHVETGEAVPQVLFERLAKTRTFRAGNAMMRQLGFAAVDLALHTQYDAERDGDVLAYARRLHQAYAPAPLPDDYALITGFTHLFAHPTGYAAGYYSYKWAEVLDADAFQRFVHEGIFSAHVGRAFRSEILARGDSRDPSELYRGFAGRDPSVEPLLERSGLAG